jgi:Cys-tRNA(Pro)/Cys-tRNA(Cys) deacylase
MTHSYPTYLDEVALLFDRIYVSAGRRGLQISIAPVDLCSITKAVLVDLV